MPTYDKEPSFLRDWALLTREERQLFMEAVAKMVNDMRASRGFRAGLRIKGVRKLSNVYEMTWADDGRATFMYGTSPHQGDVHIIWRRIGNHDILKNP